MSPDQETAFAVVGVARDAQVTRLGEIDPYYLYLPAGSQVQTLLELLVRSRADFGSTAAGIQAAVRALDPGLWVRVSPLEANLEWWRNLSGFVTALAASLGMLALVLAAVGIYGVVAYFVSRRTREIGIRMALGSSRGEVVGLVLRQGAGLVGLGLAIGIVGAAGLALLLRSLLLGLHPWDPLAFAGVVAALLLASFFACFVPARRATRVDPLVALRHE